MPIVAPLFIQDPNFTSTLHMVNDLNISTYADVILTGLDGNEITRRRIDFGPHSQRNVEIFDLLLSSISPVTTGRITVMQSPDLHEITMNSQLSITYRGGSEPNYIEEELAMPSAHGSQTLRAVSDSAELSPFVAVTSLSDSAQQILVECLGDRHFSKTVELAPRQTLVTGACAESTRPGADFRAALDFAEKKPHGPVGLSLTSDAAPGSFAAFGLSAHRTHEDTSFTAIHFSDPKLTKSANIVFTGVPVGSAPLVSDGKYIPHLELANFSGEARKLKIKYSHTSNGQPTVENLKNIVIPPSSAKHLSFDNLEGESGLENSFLITSDGNPGDVVAKLSSSVSDSSLGDVELLPKDEGNPDNGGVHPWSIEGGNESTLLLFNHSAEPQHFSVHIGNNAVLWQKAFLLQPMETRSISLRELIESKAKDDDGRILPEKLVSGQLGWLGPNQGVGKGRLLLSNRDAGLARSFSCSVIVVICAASNTSFDMPVIYTFTGSYAGILVIWCQPFTDGCSGVPNGATGTANYSWTTSQPAIASISGSSTNSSITLYGANVGASQITETAYDGGNCHQGGGGPAPVNPKLQLQGNEFNSIFVGDDSNLATPNSIFATVSPSGGTFTETSSASGDTFTPVTSGGPGWTIKTTTQSTNTGDRKLTVTYTVSGQKATQSLNVTARQFAYATNNSPSNTCTLGYGTKYLYLYTPYTHPDKTAVQPGIGLGGTAVTESFNPPLPTGAGTGNGPLDANSQFSDRIEYCNTGPLPSAPTVTQTLSIAGYQVRQNSLAYSSAGVSLTSQGPTQ